MARTNVFIDTLLHFSLAKNPLSLSLSLIDKITNV